MCLVKYTKITIELVEMGKTWDFNPKIPSLNESYKFGTYLFWHFVPKLDGEPRG